MYVQTAIRVAIVVIGRSNIMQYHERIGRSMLLSPSAYMRNMMRMNLN